MELKEAVEQLKSLKESLESSIGDANDLDDIFVQDVEGIKTVLQELERLQKENEELKEIDLTTVHIKGVCDERERWRNKIREKIKKHRRDLYSNVERYVADELEDLLKEE